MFALLAQTMPPAADLAAFVGVAAFLLVAYNQARTAFGTNPPLHKSYASKEELVQVHGRIKREREEVNSALAKIEAAALAANKRVDGELAAIRASLDDSKEAAEQRVEGLRRKIDDQTNLIISVIRKEGARR